MSDLEERVRQATPQLIAETNAPANARAGREPVDLQDLDMAVALVRVQLYQKFRPSRERSLAATKLDEFELWLARCASD